MDFNGTKREVSIDLVPRGKKNDYILVHAGFAISILSNQEAKETLNIFSEIYKYKKRKKTMTLPPPQAVRRPQKNINQRLMRRW